MLMISPAASEYHTPPIPKIRGSTSTGRTIKIMVRQKDRMAERALVSTQRATKMPFTVV